MDDISISVLHDMSKAYQFALFDVMIGFHISQLYPELSSFVRNPKRFHQM